MAYLVEKTDRNGQKSYYLQFFEYDLGCPLDKSAAAVILSAYDVSKAEPFAIGVSLNPGFETNVYEVGSGQAFLIQEIMPSSEKTYKLRFSVEGEDVYIGSEVVGWLQARCRIQPSDPLEKSHDRVKRRFFKILPTKSSCMRF